MTEVLLYPQGQNVDQGIVENGQKITWGPGGSNGVQKPEIHYPHEVYANIGDSARLQIYLPEKCNGQMVIVTPGGAYSAVCAGTEGRNVAYWLGRQGVATCVVLYRLPNHHPQVPLTDVQNAFRYCRHHASDWNVRQIGVMGFSAGGHLAAMASNLYVDELTRPDFSVLIYPVIDLEHNEGTFKNLTDGHKKWKKQLSMHYKVTSNTPRTFLALSQDDGVVNPKSSISYFNALQDHRVPSEMYIFPQGRHGFAFLPQNKEDSFHDTLGNYRMIFLDALECFLSEMRLELKVD